MTLGVVKPDDDTNADIQNADDTMPKIDIHVENKVSTDVVSASNDKMSSICTNADENRENSLLLASEKAKFRRFCSLAFDIAPNELIWEDMFYIQTNPFTPEELPFEQKTFMVGSRLQHILAIPFLKSAGTIMVSSFTLVVSVVSYHTANIDSYIFPVMTIIFVVVLLAIPGVMSIPVVYENPCRLLLYYRLWEHKIVINFKNRDLSDRGTRIKMYIYLASATMLVGHGCSYRPILPLSFFLVVIQTFGTIALTVYTNLDLESTALAINRAMENYLAKQAASENQDKKKVHPAKDGTKPNKILGKTVGAISFVSEDMVMADIITLNMCFERLMAERYESRNDEQKTQEIEEKLKWLSQCALYVGRLGNSKERLQISCAHEELSAMSFVDDVYDDALWHKHGSFGSLPRRTGLVIKGFVVCLFACVVVIGFMFYAIFTAHLGVAMNNKLFGNSTATA